MFAVDLSYDIVPAEEATPGIRNALIRSLEAIESERSLQGAAKKLGLSYRYFWGRIEHWEGALGQKLVLREQGKPASLTPLGTKLLWAERTVAARYQIQLEKLRTELNSAIAAACDPDARIITVSGCFDPWLARLPEVLFKQGIIADLRFSTSLEGLKLLSEGGCDMTGFNFPRGSTANSAAAAMLAPFVKTGKIAMCRFASRTQGLAVAAGNPLHIYSIAEIVKKGLRYAGRPDGTGTTVLLKDLLAHAGFSQNVFKPSSIEQSHRAVAVAVSSGRADAGLCVEDAAIGAGASFIPLSVEDYFLAWRHDRMPPMLDRWLQVLQSDDWKKTAENFAGVSSENCGERVDPDTLFV